MKFSNFPRSWWWWLPVIAILFSIQNSGAQVAQLKSVLQGQEASDKQDAAEKPEEIQARFDKWRLEARETLKRIETANLPEGISQSESENYRFDLEQMGQLLNRAIKNINFLAEAGKAFEDARAEDAAWTGFKEKPPYSLLMVDELLNERDAIKANLTSRESSLANYQSLQASILGEIKTAEAAVSTALTALKDADEKTSEAARWRLEAARTKSRLLVTRNELIKGSCDSLRERIAANRIDLALTERKVALAQKNSHLNDEDLTKISKIAEERKEVLRKEMDGISKRLKSAMTARDVAQDNFEELAATKPVEDKPIDALNLAKYRLEVAENRLEAMESIKEGIEGLLQLENITIKLYQDRREVIVARTKQERTEKLKALVQAYERLLAWDNVIDNEISAISADLSKLEARAASITADDEVFGLINDHRASKSEKLALFQRISKAVGAHRKMVKRWVADYTPKDDNKAWGHRLVSFGQSAMEVIRKIWSLELMTYENSVMVEGKKVSGDVPVTLGMLIRALIYFIIGYKILSFIAHRIQRRVIRHGALGEAQAKTLRNWAMIVAGFFLLIGTFLFLNIPLTVFAFFGGALAIGLGFGMQTLIKNFICGIILLVERKVRVGDLLEVDGFIGKVTEINTRSSVIRSADDLETMVPNSLFLENRVTNWTLTSGKVRRTLSVGVAYGTTPQTVMEVLTETATRHGLVCKDPAPFAIFEDFGESSLVFRLYFWLDFRGAANGIVVASDLRLMIEKRFSELEIGVPFPQREMRLNTDQPIKVHWSKDPEQTGENQ